MKIVAVLVALILALGGYAAWSAMQANSVTKSTVRKQSGPYYRITAQYLYDGQPLTLDFALGCSGAVRTYADGRSSHDVFGGPTYYGRPTPDGKVLVTTTGRYCSEFRTYLPNAGISADFLPETILFDNPDTLEFGVMYASVGAYAKLGSKLSFQGIRFERLGQEAFVAFRTTQQLPNAVRAARNDRIFAPTEEAWLGKRPFAVADRCTGWARFSVPPDLRDEVGGLWPEEKPEFWRPHNPEAYPLLEKLMRPAENWHLSWASKPGVSMSRQRNAKPTDLPFLFYPERLVSRNRWDFELGRWVPDKMVFDVRLNSESEGYLFCNENVSTSHFDGKDVNAQNERVFKLLGQWKVLVHGKPVVGLENFKSEDSKKTRVTRDAFFERNEFVYFHLMRDNNIIGEQRDVE
jgi:hypothetical protein